LIEMSGEGFSPPKSPPKSMADVYFMSMQTLLSGRAPVKPQLQVDDRIKGRSIPCCKGKQNIIIPDGIPVVVERRLLKECCCGRSKGWKLKGNLTSAFISEM
jgi:hypothetical protein